MSPETQSQVTPIYQGITFTDDAGNLLVGGQLWFYSEGSFSNLLPTYADNAAKVKNPNPLIINEHGRIDTAIFLKNGFTYNVVLTQPDGETVISHRDSVIAPKLIAGNKVEITPESGVGAVTVNSLIPDPYKGHGKTYLWYVERSEFSFTPNYQNYVAATRKLPGVITGTPDVVFLQDSSCLEFNRGGSYTITVTYKIKPQYYLSGNVMAYGTRISNVDPKLPTTPRDFSTLTRRDYYSLSQEQMAQSLTNTWTVSVIAGQRVTMDYMATSPDVEQYGSLQGWVVVNRIGEVYEGVEPPPPPVLPIASFTQDLVQGTVPFTVTFTDTSTGTPTSWAWDFGDGSTSNFKDPTHEYTVAGNYTVTLTVANANGTSAPFVGYVDAQAAPEVAPIASFIPTSGQGYTPFSVTFYDTSQNNPTSWYWEFGNGNFSYEQNPTILFDVPKQLPYDVVLTASNKAGSSTAYGQYTAWGGADWGIVPIPNFFTQPTSGSYPLTVTFTDATYGRPTGWNWDFGDGYTSSEQNPVHVYETIGDYTVTMTASNVFGTSPVPAEQPISVTGPMWRITFRDNGGFTLPIYVDSPAIQNGPIYGIPVSRVAVAQLVSQLTGLLWTLNGNEVPAYFDAQPEPDTTDNFILGQTSYCYMENYTTGRRLYLQGQQL